MVKQYDDTTNRNSNNNIKRTGEHILTWIGVAIQALVAIMFLMIKPFIGNADFKEQIINETQKQGNQVSITEINNGMDALGLSLIHISEPTRLHKVSRMPSSA